MRDLSKYKLVIFDLDDTLVPLDGTEVYPKMARFLVEHCAGKRIAIATNQGGVGLRYWMETGGFGSPERLPRMMDINKRLITIKQNLGLITQNWDIPVYVCYRLLSKHGNWSPTPYPAWSEEDLPIEWKMSYRKPNPGMLLQAMQDTGVSESETLFVGDADGRTDELGFIRDEDAQAAIAAGVDFMSANRILKSDAARW